MRILCTLSERNKLNSRKCVNEERIEEYENKKHIYLFCGIPFSGKTVYSIFWTLKYHAMFISVNRIIEEIQVNKEEKVIDRIYDMIKDKIDDKDYKRFVIDDTSIFGNYEARQSLYKRLKDFSDVTHCLGVMLTPFEVCKERCIKRNDDPVKILEGIKKFDIPLNEEPYDRIVVIRHKDAANLKTKFYLDQMKQYSIEYNMSPSLSLLAEQQSDEIKKYTMDKMINLVMPLINYHHIISYNKITSRKTIQELVAYDIAANHQYFARGELLYKASIECLDFYFYLMYYNKINHVRKKWGNILSQDKINNLNLINDILRNK